MAFKRTASLPFVSFASFIMGISISLFLRDLSLSRRLFPFIFEDIRVGIVIFESFFAYLIGFLLIATQDENTDTITKKKIVNLLLIGGIVVFMTSIGITGSSFKYLNISSFTIIVLALTYYIINPEKSYLKTSRLVSIGSSFFVLSLLVMNPNCDINLGEVSIAGYEQSGDSIQLDIKVTLCQEEAHSADIYIEMIFLESATKENAEYIGIVNSLSTGDESVLHWCVNLPAKNEEYILYLCIWSELEVKEYKIIIPEDIKIGDPLSKSELTFVEYLKIVYLRLKGIFESDKYSPHSKVLCDLFGK